MVWIRILEVTVVDIVSDKPTGNFLEPVGKTEKDEDL